jgi:Sulfotransferase domain
VKNPLKELSFKILTNTVMKDMPSKMKRHLKQSLIDGDSSTETLPFLQTKINGYVLPSYILEEDLQAYARFKTLPSDVFVASYPKSGMLWLLEIVHYITSKDAGKLDFPSMFELADEEHLEALSSPRCMLTNLPFVLLPHNNEKNVKYIYIARNPRDVAVSQYNFYKEMPSMGFPNSKQTTYTWAEFLEYFMNGEVPGGLYFDHILKWWQQKEDANVLFLKYEDLQKDIQSQVKIIAEFLGYQLSQQQIKTVAEKSSFQSMKSKPSPFMKKISELSKTGSPLRKGIVGDWQNYFSSQQLEQFNKFSEYHMNGTGLDFEFKI